MAGNNPPQQKHTAEAGQADLTEEMVAKALAEAQAAVDQIAEDTSAATTGDGSGQASLPADLTSGIDLLGDVELDVMVELGRTEMLVEDVLRLGEGSVVELDKLAGDPVDVYVNNRLVARGEVLVLNDNFCIRISEIVDDLQQQAAAAAEEQLQA